MGLMGLMGPMGPMRMMGMMGMMGMDCSLPYVMQDSEGGLRTLGIRRLPDRLIPPGIYD